MDDLGAAGVQVGQRVADGGSHQGGFALGERSAALNAVAQVFALDVIHDQVLALTGNNKIIPYPGKVGVAKTGQNVGFTLELAGVLIAEEQVFLNRHIDVQILVQGVINSPHPTLSQDRLDAVSAVKNCAGCEGHAVFDST